MKILATLLCATLILGFAAAAAAAPKVKHVVCFKFKDTASPEAIQQAVKAFAELKNKIPLIKSLEWGTNISPEKRNEGFTHCWILTFDSTKDRDDYLVHPEHKAFGKSLGPVLDKVFVIDFITQD